MSSSVAPTSRNFQRFDGSGDALETVIWRGGYQRILDRGLPPAEWLADYTATYLERDVRNLLAVGDLETFHTFLRLARGAWASS